MTSLGLLKYMSFSPTLVIPSTNRTKEDINEKRKIFNS